MSLSPVTSTSAEPSSAAATTQRSVGIGRRPRRRCERCNHGFHTRGAMWTISRTRCAGVRSLSVRILSSSSSTVSPTRSRCSASTIRSTSWQIPRVAKAATRTLASTKDASRHEPSSCSPGSGVLRTSRYDYQLIWPRNTRPCSGPASFGGLVQAALNAHVRGRRQAGQRAPMRHDRAPSPASPSPV